MHSAPRRPSRSSRGNLGKALTQARPTKRRPAAGANAGVVQHRGTTPRPGLSARSGAPLFFRTRVWSRQTIERGHKVLANSPARIGGADIARDGEAPAASGEDVPTRAEPAAPRRERGDRDVYTFDLARRRPDDAAAPAPREPGCSAPRRTSPPRDPSQPADALAGQAPGVLACLRLPRAHRWGTTNKLAPRSRGSSGASTA